MKKWVSITAGLALILGIVLVISIKDNPVRRWNSSFRISNPDNISLIIIEQGERSVELRRRGKDWFVGDLGKARNPAIEFILTAITSMEVKSPLSEERFFDLLSAAGDETVTVKIFGKTRLRLLRSFQVYSEGAVGEGSVMRLSRASIPYILDLPGYDMKPGAAFIPDPGFWLPFSIFNLDPVYIREAEIFYGNDSLPEIRIVRNDDDVALYLAGERNSDVNEEKVMRYLSYFTYVPFEKWDTRMSDKEKDMISTSVPIFRIRIVMEDGNSRELTAWSRSGGPDGGNGPDTDRVWGSLNEGKDIFVAKYYDLDPLVKRADYFK